MDDVKEKVSLEKPMEELNIEDLVKASPEKKEQPEAQMVPTEEKKNDISFSPEEEKRIIFITKSVDVLNPSDLTGYGSDAQKSVADFSDGVLSAVKTKDAGDVVGGLFADLTMSVKQIEEKDSFVRKLPIVGSLVKKKDKAQAKYRSVAENVDRVVAGLEKAKISLQKDISTLDDLYNQNYHYYRELCLYIEAGNRKMKEIRENLSPRLKQQAEDSKDPLAMQAYRDFEERVIRFEKRINDLMISKTISIQTAPQIRMIQNNNRTLEERVDSAIYNTIPLWKNQMVIAIGLENQKKVLELQHKMSETTNMLLRKNAELLKTNSIETAKENERSIVDIDTVKKINENLISTINETISIQKEGARKRAEAAKALETIEESLKTALLEASSRSIREEQK